MATKPKLSREGVKTQLNLYKDQIPTLREYFPHLGNSEIVRSILDRMIILLRESTNHASPTVPVNVEQMLRDIQEESNQ